MNEDEIREFSISIIKDFLNGQSVWNSYRHKFVKIDNNVKISLEGYQWQNIILDLKDCKSCNKLENNQNIILHNILTNGKKYMGFIPSTNLYLVRNKCLVYSATDKIYPELSIQLCSEIIFFKHKNITTQNQVKRYIIDSLKSDYPISWKEHFKYCDG